MVAAVGEDFPDAELNFLKGAASIYPVSRCAPAVPARGPAGYEDMNQRDTLDLQLNVFADFSRSLPASHATRSTCSSPTSIPVSRPWCWISSPRGAGRLRYDEPLDSPAHAAS